jgi:hypothetical protein
VTGPEVHSFRIYPRVSYRPTDTSLAW